MSLPANYTSPSEYFSDALTFLNKYQWIYRGPNNDIIVEKTLKNIPYEWCQYFKKSTLDRLKSFVNKETDLDIPKSLADFLHEVQSLTPTYEYNVEKLEFKFAHNCCLSSKKSHEILSLAPLVDTICKQNEINDIIDIGCGLGYLSHLLNDKYKYNVLGIDCSLKYIELAYKNQEKLHLNSKESVNFEAHFINEDSKNEIEKLIEKNFHKNEVKNNKICLVGLHACADLSITILDLFSKLDAVSSLVIMPCCYHRIKVKRETEVADFFENFPSSAVLKDLFSDAQAQVFIRRPFLRLACQQTANSFINMDKRELDIQSRNCFFRALLQAVATEEKCTVQRLKRKSGNTKTSGCIDEEFSMYVDNLGNNHKLAYKDRNLTLSEAGFREKMFEKWLEHKEDYDLVSILAGLQAAMQSLCENLLLLDRVEFLKERGYKSHVERVTNDCISPRCYALIAEK
ncbi:unnamed protein product [Brassicogethes aeneus]|uniref:Methyltransferase domain-containing protein n=1 Tax=Brassicogethes aeneus TaxID=1431903 RepID=A0A9P0FDN2_BRAAE|nr:unnamed protein product [Brassicogethes aeneus]